MNYTELKFFLIGLPAAGKTTFLAALWHVVTSNEVQESLQLNKLSGDQAHLNKIHDAWIGVNEIERTKISHEQNVSMQLNDANGDHVGELVFPDLSGETFKNQWGNRQMTIQHAELIQKTNGGLLLIHPEFVHGSLLIPEAEDFMQDIKPNKVEQEPDDKEREATEKLSDESAILETQWSAEESPTAIKLVELLQFTEERNASRPIPLAVIVSAWDCINEDNSAHEWIKKELPLLWQYLHSNQESYNTKYYGVSAQGGKLDEADKLRACEIPSKRIRVVMDDLSETHDISEPIKWLIEQASDK